MRVELTMDGGFAYIPGLARPVVLDTESLPPAEAAMLRRLCAEAQSAIAGARAPAGVPMPDSRRYRLVIDGDDGRREIIAADPIGSPALAALITFLRERRPG